MTDRLWDFENSKDGATGAAAVPPSPTAPPSPAVPSSPTAPGPGAVSGAPVPPPVPRPVSPPAQSAPPSMPATVSGPQSPPAGYGPPVHRGGPAAAQPGLAPSRPPRPGERLLVETPVVKESRSLWGWRALAAFVVGGLLAGLGFGIGSWNQRDDELTATTPTTILAEVPDTAPIIVEAPEIDSSEPAALVAELLGPSIVQVETGSGLGSGVVFRDGLILTNNHVIEGAGSTVSVRTPDGRTFEADVVGVDPRVDIAVLDIGPEPGLPVAELALGETPQVGQVAIAIGSPFQLQQTVTSGIVSALNRPVLTGESAFTAMLQTDTAINPGNSGGALADREGRVIGIITAIQTDGTRASNFGVGFAIPINTAVRVADRIIAGESLEAGFLGVRGEPEPGETGIVITEVTPGSGAEAAGLVVGDRVIALDDAPVTSLVELAGLVQSSFVGDEVVLQVVRNDELIALNATLGAR